MGEQMSALKAPPAQHVVAQSHVLTATPSSQKRQDPEDVPRDFLAG